MEKKKRAKRLEGGKGSNVAQQRGSLYRLANEQLKSAFEAGFYIECVSICESIIADRLEARLQFLLRDTAKPSHIDTIGRLLKQVEDTESNEPKDLTEIYEAIREWSKSRNVTIHQFVKVTDQNHKSNGVDRLRQAKNTASNGIQLMRKVSSLVRMHNKWPKSD